MIVSPINYRATFPAAVAAMVTPRVASGTGPPPPALLSYVDPTRVVFIPVDTSPLDIDPTKVIFLPDDTAPTEIDPTRVIFVD